MDSDWRAAMVSSNSRTAARPASGSTDRGSAALIWRAVRSGSITTSTGLSITSRMLLFLEPFGPA